jgi:predicted 3-demethylubiquinone-9 3-methyltransferase (glyoxalase superfamily)
MPKSVLPFLMFQGDAEAALEFYRATIPGAEVDRVERYGEGEQVPAGRFKSARLTLAGQEIMVLDSPPVHDFTFTPSFSFHVECADEDEVRTLAEALAQDGATMMPVGNYGFSRLFAWVSDRFGVSWQLNCA